MQVQSGIALPVANKNNSWYLNVIFAIFVCACVPSLNIFVCAYLSQNAFHADIDSF